MKKPLPCMRQNYKKAYGENDWLYPEEARLLDEEFSSVQSRVISEQEKTGEPE